MLCVCVLFFFLSPLVLLLPYKIVRNQIGFREVLLLIWVVRTGESIKNQYLKDPFRKTFTKRKKKSSKFNMIWWCWELRPKLAVTWLFNTKQCLYMSIFIVRIAFGDIRLRYWVDGMKCLINWCLDYMHCVFSLFVDVCWACDRWLIWIGRSGAIQCRYWC